MKRRFFLTIATALAASAALPSCAAGDDATPDYRYRLTVEVDTPEGSRTGSSVIEVGTSVAGEYSIPTPGGVSHRVRGEAVAVDLPNGRTLFALLRSENKVDWADNVMFLLAPSAPKGVEDAFQMRFDSMLQRKGLIHLPRMWPPVGHLPERSAYPMLVTFGDLDNPTSVEQVDPDVLAATFGEGYEIERITVQLTDDPVTVGIEGRLRWLDTHIGSLVKRENDQTVGEMPLAHRLGTTNFRVKE